MAKRLLEQSKRGHWNIKCGDSEYFHRFACEYPTGCHFSGWSECQWSGYCTHLQYQKKLTKVKKSVDIITSAIAVFETSVSKALNSDGETNQ